jgi:hypothetical protein
VPAPGFAGQHGIEAVVMHAPLTQGMMHDMAAPVRAERSCAAARRVDGGRGATLAGPLLRQ